ncbi:MAG: hypothetical protein JNM40_19510 [Myxococcales bacterium]|nr:hypothetical protein [Myxococcales bacterium]
MGSKRKGTVWSLPEKFKTAPEVYQAQRKAHTATDYLEDVLKYVDPDKSRVAAIKQAFRALNLRQKALIHSELRAAIEQCRLANGDTSLVAKNVNLVEVFGKDNLIFILNTYAPPRVVEQAVTLPRDVETGMYRESGATCVTSGMTVIQYNGQLRKTYANSRGEFAFGDVYEAGEGRKSLGSICAQPLVLLGSKRKILEWLATHREEYIKDYSPLPGGWDDDGDAGYPYGDSYIWMDVKAYIPGPRAIGLFPVEAAIQQIVENAVKIAGAGVGNVMDSLKPDDVQKAMSAMDYVQEGVTLFRDGVDNFGEVKGQVESLKRSEFRNKVFTTWKTQIRDSDRFKWHVKFSYGPAPAGVLIAHEKPTAMGKTFSGEVSYIPNFAVATMADIRSKLSGIFEL